MTTKLSISNLSAETLAAITGPRISNVQITDSAYNTLDDTAANIGGGYIIINGQSFNSAAQVIIDQTPATTVTWVSNTKILAQVPAAAEGESKSVYVINPDGSLALLVNGLTYSAFPAWSTGSTLTSFEALVPVSIQLSAPSATVYTLATANTLPSALSLYANGLIAGTVAANTTTNYNFTVNAKDAENQDTNRNFTLPITQNVEPAWVTAANLVGVAADASYSNTLVATDLSNVTYSVAAGSSLPSSLTLAANGLLSGSVSAANTYSFAIVATDTANLSNTRTFTLTITVAGDTYFKNTTLLLNGETTSNSFIADASTNNFGLTIAGDTKPVLFNPYQGDGYYSNYFDGTGDYLTAPANAAWNFTGDWTFECWVYPTAITGYHTFLGQWGAPDNVFIWKMNSSGRMYLENLSTALTATSTTIVANQWQHIALTRSSNTIRMFVNGVLDSTTATRSGTYYSSGVMYVGASGVAEAFTGYISNMRILNGTALYTSTFTPPTTPLTAIANTSLLTCQSNRFLDKSTNNFTMTKAGDTLVSSTIPFTASSSYSTYGSTYFDGTGDYLTTPITSSGPLDFGSGNWTVEAWVMYTGASLTGGYRNFLTFCNDSGLPYIQIGTKTSTGYVFAEEGTQSAVPWTVAGTTLLTSNVWHHIAAVRNSNNIYLYLDGVLQGSVAYSGTHQTFAKVQIGSLKYNGSIIQDWTGYIADVRIVKGTAVYTSTFTPPTTPLTAVANTSLLTLQYNGGATNQGIIDNSNFNNIITRSGNATQGTFSPYSVTGWSNYFNGSSDYFTAAASGTQLTLTGNWTIEFWINTLQTARADVVSPNYTYTSTGWFVLAFGYTTTGASGTIDYVETGGGAAKISGTLNRDGLWHHIALTKSGTSMKLFIDGTQTGSTYTTSQTQWGSTGNGWIIGDQTSSSTYYQGYISNFRALNGTALYTTAFTPPTSPLTAITNTSFLTCQSNRYIDNGPNNLAITLAGTPQVQAYSPFGSITEATPLSYSTYFAGGASDYLTVTTGSSQLNLPSDFTVELWFCETNTTPTIPQFASGTTGGFACGINAYDGNATRKLDWRASGSAPVYGVTAITTNVWHHAAYVKSGSTFRIFLDGVLEYYNGSYSTTFTSTATYIGSQNSGDAGYSFRGYISNFRVVKGTAVYTTSSTTIGASIFTPSTTPLTAITNTALLTCQSTRIIDNSTNALTMTGTGTYTVKQFNPFGYTAQSAISYTPSLHGGSIYLDGTLDKIQVAESSQINFGNSDFTIEFWVYFNSVSSEQCLVNKGWQDTQAYASYCIYLTSSGNLNFLSSTNGGSWDIASDVLISAMKSGQWYHIALTRSGTSFKAFVNGIQQSFSITSSGTLYNSSGQKLYIGGRVDNNDTLNGYMSDVRLIKGYAVYTSSFVPPAQTLGNYSATYPSSLLLNFNNGGIIDQHSTNVLETVGNAQLSTAVKKYGNASMYFDGTGDYLLQRASPQFAFGTGDFTVECWIYATSASDNSIFESRSGVSATNGFTITAFSSSVIRIYTSSAIISSSGTTYLNTWTHVAVARVSGTTTLYINGVSAGTSASMSDCTNTDAIIGGGRYGGTATVNSSFNGYIDDFRITKGYARYTSNFTAPTSALTTK